MCGLSFAWNGRNKLVRVLAETKVDVEKSWILFVAVETNRPWSGQYKIGSNPTR